MNQIRDGFSYKTQWTIRRYADRGGVQAGAATGLTRTAIFCRLSRRSTATCS